MTGEETHLQNPSTKTKAKFWYKMLNGMETPPFRKEEPYDPAKKAINKNEGKLRWSLLLTDFQPELTILLRQWAVQKYDRFNPFKEQDEQSKEDNLDSIERHLMGIRAGSGLTLSLIPSLGSHLVSLLY